MAAPNLVGITTIVGVTTYLNLSTTDATLLVSNPSASDNVYKINSLIVANIDGSSSADITVKLHDAAAGLGVSYSIANTVAVAADSTLVVLDRASAIYLEENKSISVTASAANDLSVICSYETITD
jgi:hypothetical protein